MCVGWVPVQVACAPGSPSFTTDHIFVTLPQSLAIPSASVLSGAGFVGGLFLCFDVGGVFCSQSLSLIFCCLVHKLARGERHTVHFLRFFAFFMGTKKLVHMCIFLMTAAFG